MTLKQQTVSGVKWGGVSMVTVTLCQFLTLIILSRLISPSDFGLMGMIMVVIGFAQAFADMGISNAVIHHQDTSKDQLSSLYWLNLLAGIVVFCIVWGSTPLVIGFYNEPRLAGSLHITSVIFLITPLGQQFQILLQKELKFNKLSKIEIIAAIINSSVAIVSAFAGLGVYSLIWGQLAAATAKSALLCELGWRKWKPSIYFSKKGLKEYARFGIYQMGERAINYLNSNLDYLLIGSLLGAKPLGYYTLAYNLILRPSVMINPIVTKVAFPVFAIIQNETDKLRSGYLKILRVLSIINFPIMIGLAVIAPAAVPVIFGKQWTNSIVLIQILSIVGLLRSTGNPVGSLLLAKGRADLGFKWNIALTLLQFPGLYYGAKIGGVVGVAVAFSALMIVYSQFNYLILVRTLLGPCLREYVGSMWPALWMSGLMGVVVIVIGVIFQTRFQAFLLALQIISGISLFIGLIRLNQKALFIETKNMILKREVSFAKK